MAGALPTGLSRQFLASTALAGNRPRRICRGQEISAAERVIDAGITSRCVRSPVKPKTMKEQIGISWLCGFFCSRNGRPLLDDFGARFARGGEIAAAALVAPKKKPSRMAERTIFRRRCVVCAERKKTKSERTRPPQTPGRTALVDCGRCRSAAFGAGNLPRIPEWSPGVGFLAERGSRKTSRPPGRDHVPRRPLGDAQCSRIESDVPQGSASIMGVLKMSKPSAVGLHSRPVLDAVWTILGRKWPGANGTGDISPCLRCRRILALGRALGGAGISPMPGAQRAAKDRIEGDRPPGLVAGR